MKSSFALALFVLLVAAERPQAQRAEVPPELARVLACNDLRATPGGVRLSCRLYDAEFGLEGLRVQPRSGPTWTWRLAAVKSGERALDETRTTGVRSEIARPGVVRYARGGLAEEYVVGVDTFEQRFVIHEPLELEGRDLVIDGAVECDGTLERTNDGWRWRDARGFVTLGDVYVFDADGAALPAAMSVTSDATRIVIEGEALASARYPVIVDPEIGANDFRISDMGPDGDGSYIGRNPVAAYNDTDDVYLVVWHGSDDAGLLAVNEDEIWGQLIDGATGAEIGVNDFRISSIGTDGSSSSHAREPAVAYNSTDNEFLVVWEGLDLLTGGLSAEFEIYGQRLNGSTGAEIGVDDFRISDAGPDGTGAWEANHPAVAYNPTHNEYLVVWEGEDDIPPLVNGEHEIFGQRIDGATGAEIGTNDFRITHFMTDGDADFDALSVDVAYNPTGDEYLVVYQGGTSFFNGAVEIYGQRVDGATGAGVGTSDFPISAMGPAGNPAFEGEAPAVAYNPTDDEYLVVWSGDDDDGSLVDQEFEIYGQRLDATGAEIGADDFRISAMGADGDATFDALLPEVAYRAASNEYVVVWDGTSSLNKLEIFAQWIDGATGAEVGVDDCRVSDMGPEDDSFFFGTFPDVAVNTANGELLVVWFGRDDTPPLAGGEFEVFGQLYDGVAFVPAAIAFYGCGTNPPGSLTLAGGSPTLGGTVTLAVHNPLGTQAPGSATALALATTPDAAFPCGTLLPGFGMAGLGAPGEVLLSLAPPPFLVVAGPPWPGAPTPIALDVPENCSGLGVDVFVQGVIVDPTFGGGSGAGIGLTDAARLTLGL